MKTLSHFILNFTNKLLHICIYEIITHGCNLIIAANKQSVNQKTYIPVIVIMTLFGTEQQWVTDTSYTLKSNGESFPFGILV